MKIQKPSIRNLQSELTRLKQYICDEYICDDDDKPHIDITLACDEKGFALQTGDNSFTGSAYFHKNWGIGHLYRNSNCKELAKDLINQCEELAYDY